MTIQVGDTIPSVSLMRIGSGGVEELDTDTYLRRGRVILFGVPGAFTGTCHKVHVPGFLAKFDELKAKGVDRIVCLSVNDPFVMRAWADATGAESKIDMLGDWNAELTKALGLEQDFGVVGLGLRCRRFALHLENGVVVSLHVEEGRGVTVSGADACLARL